MTYVQGGETIWGNRTNAPDDPPNATHSHGELIAFRDVFKAQDNTDTKNMTAYEAGDWILEHTPESFQVSHSHHTGLVLG